MSTPYYQILVIGGGLAGLRAAVEAHDQGCTVAVITKVYAIRSHSLAAQGGINAALGNHPQGMDDTWERHAFDTIKGSDYLADQPGAEILAQDAPASVLEMDRWGTGFSRFENGKIAQRPFGGAGFPRTCYAEDRTGHHLLHTLWEQCLKRKIPFFSEWLLTKIVTDTAGKRVAGVIAMHIPSGLLQSFSAGAVVIAGGGHGRIYNHSTNALINTGSATAAAYMAGAPLEDMEFVQFHPTTLYGTNILITEGVRGEGGILLNARGERFMEKYAPAQKELAPRDIVARSIQTEVMEARGLGQEKGGKDSGYVHLDITRLGESLIKQRLPGIREIAMSFAGVDPVNEPLPVIPGQHYSMGGLACDFNSETPLTGLFAAGECSCISIHGANRLGGNSLLETLVFGKRAGIRATQIVKNDYEIHNEKILEDVFNEHSSAIRAIKSRPRGERQEVLRREMKSLMTRNAGIFRDEASLFEAALSISELKNRYREQVLVSNKADKFNYDLVDTLELEGMLELAHVTALTALKREESRGSHSRTDFPSRNDSEWLRHSLAYYNGKNEPVIKYKDVEVTKYKPTERKY